MISIINLRYAAPKWFGKRIGQDWLPACSRILTYWVVAFLNCLTFRVVVPTTLPILAVFPAVTVSMLRIHRSLQSGMALATM
jgi:hypothetical protein